MCPTPFTPVLPTIPARYFDCERYEQCLDHAISQDWKSWRCTECKLAPAELTEQVLSSVPDEPADDDDGDFGRAPPALQMLQPGPSVSAVCAGCQRLAPWDLTAAWQDERWCILCRPQLGRDISPRLQRRICRDVPGGPLVRQAELAEAWNCSATNVNAYVQRHDLVYFRHGRHTWMPRGLFGLQVRPPPLGTELTRREVAEYFGQRGTTGEVIRSLFSPGEPRIPWERLARWLVAACVHPAGPGR